ncbi:MAG: segregation and condensation protein A [Puniceicoccaceae bacterium 5H]|nr:MAG: segregation and condensation protein A [Puniceicoccaceae bacterium 5H]
MSDTAELNSFLPRTDHPIRLSAFEGPLDLLLFLIRRQEIDIYDIPIEQVTRQYLDILRATEERQLEVAGEFFVMAATLMQIKSRMLLPPEQAPEEEESDEDDDLDPRWELVQQLLEYRRFKEAAIDLADLVDQAQALVERRVEQEAEKPEERPLVPTDHVELWNTFNRVLRRLAEKVQVGEIEDETVTVAERMEAILKRLPHQHRFTFTELLAEQEKPSLMFVVATFLALLELTRLKRLSLEQEENFTDISCLRREDSDGESLFSNPEAPPAKE